MAGAHTHPFESRTRFALSYGVDIEFIQEM